MIQDRQIMQAISRIAQRAERQSDTEKIVASYVDVGVLPQLNNRNNQIIYGRRGTGKTHILRVLDTQLQEEKNTIVVYIDARTLGSTSQFSDHTLPLQQRCLALFRDILLPIYEALLQHIVYYTSKHAEQALASLDDLKVAIVDPVKIYQEDSVSTSAAAASGNERDFSAGFEPGKTVGLNFSNSSQDTLSGEIKRSYRVRNEDKVLFPELNSALTRTLRLAGVELYILIDEWSSLPQDVQPYLAEFLKRGVLPVREATLKIASLEYRSRFGLTDQEPLIGFELGADIAISLDLDDYFVFDRNPEQIISTYEDILLRHLEIELPDKYLSSTYKIMTAHDLASKMFTEKATFTELARASEGVIRDLMNIFSLAFFDAQRRKRDTIDRRAITQAARKWFEQDKVEQLDATMQTILRQIVEEVIGNKRARSFLLPRNLEHHTLIQKLFDSRVLHHLQRGYADKDNPGTRYNIYTLDYGTYIDLIGTSKQPLLNLIIPDEESVDNDIVVPFDDKRSIRRIILTEELLNVQGPESLF